MKTSAVFPDLKGASVLITGGGSGIGAALTEGFAQQGARVAFIDIADKPSTALAERVEKEVGLRPLFLKTDVRDIAALRAAVDTAIAAHGDITVLINNALDDRHAVEDVTPEFGTTTRPSICVAFLHRTSGGAGMKRAGHGSIINFTSTSYLINHPDMPSYTAAEPGILGLTKGLARQALP